LESKPANDEAVEEKPAKKKKEKNDSSKIKDILKD
jgi:hypothetical protein